MAQAARAVRGAVSVEEMIGIDQKKIDMLADLPAGDDCILYFSKDQPGYWLAKALMNHTDHLLGAMEYICKAMHAMDVDQKTRWDEEA